MNSRSSESLRTFGSIALVHALLACALDFPRPEEVAAMHGGARTQILNGLTQPSSAISTPNDVGWGDPAPPASHAQANDAAVDSAITTPAPQSTAGSPPQPSAQAPAPPETADAGTAPTPDPFTLYPLDFRVTPEGLALPLGALSPRNQSPAFSWSGVPAGARSLALVYRDVELDLVRWVIWDIPTSLTELPAGILPLPNPSEVPGSSQRGTGGSLGYTGPFPPSGHSEFSLWALDVAELPNATLLGAARVVSERLPQHLVAVTPAIVVTNGL